MKALVTGAAGFIGSHLVESLLADGHHVVGIDAMTDYYDTELKSRNLDQFTGSGNVEVVLDDLCSADLDVLLTGVDHVYHLAGQPGVRASWRDGFGEYLDRNVLATQRLLEAVGRSDIDRMVYASSSSVYGNALTFPTPETALPAPYSPYGVTKLAAEHLCGLYAGNFDVHVTSVRYFTVYGPRQRPDMAIHRMIKSALSGQSFPLFGDGQQRRDFTYVADAASATRRAATADVPPGSVFNVGGGSDCTVLELIEMVEAATQCRLAIDRRAPEPGDARRTGADVSRARNLLGWTPSMSLADGIAAQVAAFRDHSRA